MEVTTPEKGGRQVTPPEKIVEAEKASLVAQEKAEHAAAEEVILALEKDRLLAVLQHPNRGKYPSQQIYIVEIENYAWIVPFVETEETVFLKTIIPSRKMTKIYLTGDKNGKNETR